MAQALAYLERDACFVRRGHAGATRVRAEGFVAAAFRHRSSRAGDPLLHTHVVVANAAQGPDGRWTALDGRELYRHAKVAGYLYQAALRAELSNSLGVEWPAATHGAADIKGVPRAVIEHFSQRRAEILEHMESRGERSARAAQVATLETRRQKEYGVPVARLRAEWRARAAEHGLDSAAVRSLLHRRPERHVERHDDLAERLEGPEGLTRDRSTFTRRDVLQAFAEHARDGATVASVESRADAFLARAEIVELDPAAGERRYSTRELLEIEGAALHSAERRREGDTAVADERALDDALVRRPSMSAEQRELVTALVRGGRGVEVVRAPAGAGKTFALDAAREAWQASGVAVIGCALSAQSCARAARPGGHRRDHDRAPDLRAGRRGAPCSGLGARRGRGRDGRHAGPGTAHRRRGRGKGEARPRRRRPPASRDPGRRAVRRSWPTGSVHASCTRSVGSERLGIAKRSERCEQVTSMASRPPTTSTAGSSRPRPPRLPGSDS